MKFIKQLSILSGLLILFSCAPVNRRTKIKRTPREHSLNLCLSEIRAPKTDYNKEGWIVFSDLDMNPTFVNPGGKIKLKEMVFGEAFFVIKEKGEYLQLIKYDPEVIDNNLHKKRLTNRKVAEYYGWVHRSRMLLTKQSAVDIGTGFKNKAVTIITDTAMVNNAVDWLGQGAVWAFKDEYMTLPHQEIALHEIIYPVKLSPDGKKYLIASTPVISAEESQEELLGWVPAACIAETGQRLFADLLKEPAFTDVNIYPFYNKDKSRLISFSHEDTDRLSSFREDITPLRYNPVLSLCQTEACCLTFKTSLVDKILDKQLNYIFNVNGNKIMYDNLPSLKTNLNNINVFFVFEGRPLVYRDFPQIMNVIQNLQPFFENDSCNFNFQYNAIITSRDKSNSRFTQMHSSGLSSSYEQLMDFLVRQSERIDNEEYLPATYPWIGLQGAIELAEKQAHETNLMIVIGESGYSEVADNSLVERMAAANCRLMGYQVNSEISDAGNNFVLQIENMIDQLARRVSEAKREIIVYPSQIKPENQYREVEKNVYALDFPQNAMTQGWILFPDKNSSVPIDVLSGSITAFVNEVCTDHRILINSIHNAFRTVGSSKDIYNPVWLRRNNLEDEEKPSLTFMKRLSTVPPAFYMESDMIRLTENPDSIQYHLLLSHEELTHLISFMDRVSLLEPDYKYKGKKINSGKKVKLCNCPDDELIEKVPVNPFEEYATPDYQNTSKLRKKLYKVYLDELKSLKACPLPTDKPQSVSLAQSHYQITGCPVSEKMLKDFTIRDIKKKSNMSDLQMDDLVQYFKSKKVILEDQLRKHPENKFTSNGIDYYWVSMIAIP